MTPRADDVVTPLLQVKHGLECFFDGCLCKPVTPVCGPPQTMAPVENRLVTLTDKIILCNRLLNDLKDLSDVLVVSPVLFPLNLVTNCTFEN